MVGLEDTAYSTGTFLEARLVLKHIGRWLLGVTFLGLALSYSLGQEKPEPAKKGDAKKEELKKRFEARYEKLRELRHQGVVGETYQGYVDFVKGKKNEPAADIVEKENADRKELYQLIAEETGTTAEHVGEQNGQRRFAKAATGEWLKDAKGEWHQKT